MKDQIKVSYDVIIDKVYDVNRYMVQINDHYNKKIHILPNTYESVEAGRIASSGYIDNLIDKELKIPIV